MFIFHDCHMLNLKLCHRKHTLNLPSIDIEHILKVYIIAKYVVLKLFIVKNASILIKNASKIKVKELRSLNTIHSTNEVVGSSYEFVICNYKS